jgi:C_GCAxxG_C_C family probable redox protein
MSKGDEARNLFMEGCNCSQSVATAFSEEIGIPPEQVKRLTIGFGAGIGRLREVCGAVSGAAFVISALYDEEKGSIYARIQDVAGQFHELNGTIICRELLGLEQEGASSPVPQARTAEYYETRPCPRLVHQMADILERYIAQNPPA